MWRACSVGGGVVVVVGCLACETRTRSAPFFYFKKKKDARQKKTGKDHITA